MSKGSLLRHDKLIDFIQRNYEADTSGQWYFQNGPQRVYVELEATPLVCRVHTDFSVYAHTGEPARVQRSIVDQYGRLYLETGIGFGLVHTQDMTHAAEAVDCGLWVPQEIQASELPLRFGYVRSPARAQKRPFRDRPFSQPEKITWQLPAPLAQQTYRLRRLSSEPPRGRFQCR